MNDNDLMLAVHELFERVELHMRVDVDRARDILSDAVDCVANEREHDAAMAKESGNE